MQENKILQENGDFRAVELSNVSGQDVYYLVLKFLSATIGNWHHMMAVLEHYGGFNAQEGTYAEDIFIVCPLLLLFKNVYTVGLRVVLF